MYTKSLNTKKTWLGAMFTFALVAIMGLTFAFKPAQENKSLVYQTYYYDSNSQDPLEENKESNWKLGSGTGSCDGGDVLCTISAPEGMDGHPDFDGISNVRTSEDIFDLQTRD